MKLIVTHKNYKVAGRVVSKERFQKSFLPGTVCWFFGTVISLKWLNMTLWKFYILLHVNLLLLHANLLFWKHIMTSKPTYENYKVAFRVVSGKRFQPSFLTSTVCWFFGTVVSLKRLKMILCKFGMLLLLHVNLLFIMYANFGEDLLQISMRNNRGLNLTALLIIGFTIRIWYRDAYIA